MTKKGVFKLLAYLSGAYPRAFRPGPEDAAIWAGVWGDALSDFDDEAALAAARAYVKAESFPPAPADLRRLLAPALPTAGEAWEEAWRLARAEGYGDGETPVEAFSNPLAAKAAQAVGWANLCGLTLPTDERAAADRISYLRRDFLRIYAELRSGAAQEATRGAIAGGFPRELAPHLKAIEGGGE
jgi:hypothetical protein